MNSREQFSNGSDKTDLDPADKELFLEEWDLKDGDLSDEQILMAIKTGHF